MNLEQFNGFLNSPAALNGQSLPLLTELVKEYPYFQTAQILLAKNLHNEKNIRYNAQLKIAAAYSADRKRLFELINGVAEVQKKPIQLIVQQEKPVQVIEEKKEIKVPEKSLEKPIFKPEKEVEKAIVAEKKVETKQETVSKKAEIKPDEKHTFTEWLRLTSIHSVKAVEIEREKKKSTPKSDLIDKFIREEPKICLLYTSPSPRD